MSFSKRDFNCTCFSGDKPEWSGTQEWKIFRGSTQKPAGSRKSPASWLDYLCSFPPYPAATARNPQVCIQRATARRGWGSWLCHSISLRNSLSYGHQWGRRRGEWENRLWCGWDRWSGLELLGKQTVHPVHVPVLPSYYSQFGFRHPGCAKQMLVERVCVNKGMCWIISK